MAHGYKISVFKSLLYKTPSLTAKFLLPSATVIFFRKVHFSNATSPKLSRFSGKEMLSRASHPQKAQSPMDLSVFGKDTSIMFFSDTKASFPIEVIPSPITTFLIPMLLNPGLSHIFPTPEILSSPV